MLSMPGRSIALGGGLLCGLTLVARVPDSLSSSHTARWHPVPTLVPAWPAAMHAGPWTLSLGVGKLFARDGI